MLVEFLQQILTINIEELIGAMKLIMIYDDDQGTTMMSGEKLPLIGMKDSDHVRDDIMCQLNMNGIT